MPHFIQPEEVIRVLNAAKVSFTLVGAHGLGGWTGKPRATEDVDVVVIQRHVKKAVAALTRLSRTWMLMTIQPWSGSATAKPARSQSM